MNQRIRVILIISFFSIFIAACIAPTVTEAVPPIATQPSDTSTPLPPSKTPTSTSTPTLTLTPTLSVIPSFTPTFTNIPTPSETPTPTMQPPIGNLRANVIPERLSCRFGPGIMYLFKFSVFGKIEVIGRMEGSSWLLVRAIGGENSCWVNGDYVELLGEKAALEPKDPHIVLPWSPYYDPLTGVSAVRNGDIVTVFWDPLYLRAGDDSEQVPYVVEAWVCQDGEFVFAPVGAYALAAEIRDETGCSEESHGRVFAAEKHGYTQWVTVQWPPHVQP